METIVCPNCGANTTNYQNCEYCGSLLVRFENKHLPLDLTRYGHDAFTFNGLKEALRNNLEEQQKSNGQNHVHTFIRYGDTTLLEVMNPRATRNPVNLRIEGRNYHIDPFDINNINALSLTLCIRFCIPKAHNSLLGLFEESDIQAQECFLSMDIAPLFSVREDKLLSETNIVSGVVYSYFIDFGQDYEGAAKIISQYLLTQYNITEKDYSALSYHSEINTDTEIMQSNRTLQKKAKKKQLLVTVFGIMGLLVSIGMIVNGENIKGILGIVCSIILIFSSLQHKS